MGLLSLSRRKAKIVNKLRRLWGKKQIKANDKSLVQAAQPEAISPEDATETLSLWDRAYNALRSKDAKLVDDYEDLLSKEMQNGGLPDTLGDDGADKQSQRALLQAVIAAGLHRIESKRTRYTIAGHEFNLSNQIDQAAKLVIWAKDWIGEAVKRSPEASIAWVGVSVILPLLTNPKVADEANRDGFTYVTTRMEYYAALEPLLLRLGDNREASPTLMAEANNHVIRLYQCILEFQIKSVLRFYKSRPRRYAGDAVQNEDWKKMLGEIKEFEGIINRTLLQVNQFAARRELEVFNIKSTESLETIRQLLSVSEGHVHVAIKQLGIAQRSLKMQEDTVKQMCLQLFRLTDSSKDVTYEWYKDRVEARLEGTCEWFLKHENFQRWSEQDSGPLLVSADPGCGKSVLAKHLIDSGLPRSSTICYFFFKDQDQNTSRQALCALLHQLLSLKPHLIEHAIKQFKIDGEGLINSTNSLWTILRNAVQDPEAGPIIIVLDALDECAEIELKDLVRNIERQFHGDQSSTGKLRYLLTSRPYEQILSNFRHLLNKFPYIRIPGEEESETISQEVNKVIKYRVENLAKGKNLSDPVKHHLEEMLLKIPHRTYLWVYLVFDYLEKEDFKKTPNGVDATIATLPRSVYEAYEKILSKSKGDSAIVRKALSIIIAAVRPLTVAEMNVALNVDDVSTSLSDIDLEEEEDFKLRLRALCGLFVSIHDGKVYFLHHTVREFLMIAPSATALSLEGHWQNSISSPDAHQVLAKTCMILLDLDLDEILLEEYLNTARYYTIHAFFTYSATNWNTHFLETDSSLDISMISLAFKLCDPDEENCEWWFQEYWNSESLGFPPSPLTSLIVSSFCGNHIITRMLLERDTAELEIADTQHGRTPLLWTVLLDHDAVVRVLLEYGANTEAEDESTGYTSLFYACLHGLEKIFMLLLEKESVNIDFAVPSHGQTGLCCAAARGHAGIVSLLLNRGADIDHQDKLGQTALMHAVQRGHTEIVQLLIERGANLEFEKNQGKMTLTALSLAARRGQTAVAELLLDAGANLEHECSYSSRTPLSLAAEGRYSIEGFSGTVKMLLERGVDMESRDADFDHTPLLWAAESGHINTVRHLLDYGANIGFQSSITGETALSLATEFNRKETVQLLLERGAERLVNSV
ncbi:hypothetical protein NPX13_g5069 [Xylaria arbuscula]|uniref:NWD NACHT-NTPase N-terminal domain-containing protein n=1 Tax=Xylaria arbuscula TaxID=114810 RepID=A0A9W8TNH8_9PEZI|nr:hypothetical protein NPX13_g5069 [Xylaria arbuscula]